MGFQIKGNNDTMKFIAYKFMKSEDGEVYPIDNERLPIKQILDNIMSKKIENRYNGGSIRLENVTHYDSDGYSMAIFGQERSSGPGRGRKKDVTVDFNLDAEEFFAEQTMVLFCHSRNIMICQFNQHGAKGHGICDYVSSWANKNGILTHQFFSELIVEKAVVNRILARNEIKGISGVVYCANTTNTSLKLTGKDLPSNLHKVQFSMKPEKQGGKLENSVEFIRNAMKDVDVSDLVVRARLNDEGEFINYNLQNHRVYYERSISRNETSHRYVESEITAALKDAYTDFTSNNKLGDSIEEEE